MRTRPSQHRGHRFRWMQIASQHLSEGHSSANGKAWQYGVGGMIKVKSSVCAEHACIYVCVCVLSMYPEGWLSPVRSFYIRLKRRERGKKSLYRLVKWKNYPWIVCTKIKSFHCCAGEYAGTYLYLHLYALRINIADCVSLVSAVRDAAERTQSHLLFLTVEQPVLFVTGTGPSAQLLSIN